MTLRTGNAEGLMELHSRWEWDGDLMRCRGCGRGLHVSRQGEPLAHASHCKLYTSFEDPWYNFRFLMNFVGAEETSDKGES